MYGALYVYGYFVIVIVVSAVAWLLSRRAKKAETKMPSNHVVIGREFPYNPLEVIGQKEIKPYRGVAEDVTWPPPPPASVVNIDLDAVHRALDAIPNKVLQAVISSSNNLKGNLGELIGYLKLHAAYDRIIPLGNIVDFICIKLPKDGKEGHIDFVDIKTGGSAKLSKDQVQLKKLIEEKKINFVKLKVETNIEPTGEEK